MRHSTWGYKEEKMRTRSGYHAYHMRCWLRLLWHSQLSLSYPLPLSMLTPEGIDHNNTPFSGFMSPWNQTKTSSSPTTCIATIFLFSSIITWPQQLMVMKNGSCGAPPWYILIGDPFHAVLVLCRLSTNAIATSFQNLGSCSPLDLRDW